jgi:hypothetical protein
LVIDASIFEVFIMSISDICLPVKSEFDLGHTVASPDVLEFSIKYNVNLTSIIERHRSCDFGDITIEQRHSNVLAVTYGGNIFSAYRIDNGFGDYIWVETCSDRRSTHITLP